MANSGDSSFELRGVGIDLLRVLVALANGINPDPDYWTIGRVGALLVGNHESWPRAIAGAWTRARRGR